MQGLKYRNILYQLNISARQWLYYCWTTVITNEVLLVQSSIVCTRE